METQRADIDQLFARWDKPHSPGCALAVIHSGQIIYKRGYGQATLEYDVSITPATIFHVASVSKQFTASASALLMSAGKLSLDDDVRRFVPELPDFGNVIKVSHLIHHTSGLRDQWELLIAAGWRMSDVITTADIMELVRNQRELNFRPGAEYSYCNTGYTLLAQIVERISGFPFPEFCTRRIFEPLGMNSTHFHDDHRRVVQKRAYSYNPDGSGGFRNAVLSYANAGATSLFTTVEDLAQWDQNFYDARVGGQAVIDLMHTRGVLNDGTLLPYAFGLVLGEYRGLRTVEHAGGDAGFRSMLMRFPDQHFTVVLAGNVSDLNPGQLAHQVADICLAGQFASAAPSGRAAALLPEERDVVLRNLPDKAGVYHCATTSETLLLEVRDGNLVMPSEPGLELAPVGPERFQLTVAPEIEFHFETAVTGQRQVRQLNGKNKPIIYTAMTPAQLAPDQLAAYTGRYYSLELDVSLYIKLQQGELLLHQRKLGDGHMRPTFDDAFKCIFQDDPHSPSSFDMLFERDAGAVSGFRLSAGRIRHVYYARVANT